MQDTASRPVPPADIVTTDFSNWGPTDDGRIKPDIIANGQSLLSAGFSLPAAGAPIVEKWQYKSGTSMAAPTVTGGIALLQEYYHQLHSTPGHDRYMDAATVRALVCHTARDDATPGPSYSVGWGLFDAKNAYDVLKKDGNPADRLDEVRSLTYTGQPTELRFYTDGAKDIKITIAWTDPDGPLQGAVLDDATPRLVNDLNLRVYKGAGGGTNVFLPWVLDPAHPADPATRGNNTRDNIEQVFIPAAGVTPGWYTVRISHGGALTGVQQLAMVVEGVEERAELYGARLGVTQEYFNHTEITGAFQQEAWAVAQVVNAGSADAGPFKVKFYLSRDATIDPATDMLLRVQDGMSDPAAPTQDHLAVPALAAGQTYDRMAALALPGGGNPFPGGDGNYFLGMVIDADLAVLEGNEVNNLNRGLGKDLTQAKYWLDPVGTVDMASRDLSVGRHDWRCEIEPDSVNAGADDMLVMAVISKDGVITNDDLHAVTFYQGPPAGWPGEVVLYNPEYDGVPMGDPWDTDQDYYMGVVVRYNVRINEQWEYIYHSMDETVPVHWSPDVYTLWGVDLPDSPAHDLSDLTSGTMRAEWDLLSTRAEVPSEVNVPMEFWLVRNESGAADLADGHGLGYIYLGAATHTGGVPHSGGMGQATGAIQLANIPASDPFGTAQWVQDEWSGQWQVSPYWILTDIDPGNMIGEYWRHNNEPITPVFYMPDLTGESFSAVLIDTTVQGAAATVFIDFEVRSRFGVALPEWRIDFYLSADATIDTGDLNLGSYVVDTRIAPNGVVGDLVWFDIPAGAMAPGVDYTVGMMIDHKSHNPYPEHDDNDAVPRENNANVGLGVDQARIRSKADLAWVKVTMPPPQTYGWGDTFNVELELSNQGKDASVATSGTIKLWTDPFRFMEIGTFAVPALGVGASSGTIQAAVTLPTGPVPDVDTDVPVYLNFFLDDEGLVDEADENNNSAWALGSPLTVRIKGDAAPLPDLVADFDEDALADVLIPGDKVKLPVRVTNAGTAEADGRIGVGVYASADKLLGPDDVALAELMNLRIALPAGADRAFAASFVVPADVAAGEYYILVAVDTEDAIAESDENNNVTASADTREVAWKFGNVPGRKAVRLAVTDSADTPVTFTLKGGGWAEVVGGSALTEIIVHGSTFKTSLIIAAKGKGVRPLVGDIRVNGSIKSIVGKTTALGGDVTVTGTAKAIMLGDVADDHTITIGAPAAGNTKATVALTFGRVADTTINSQTPIKSLRVVEWLDTGGAADAVHAPWLGKLTTKGNKKAGIPGHFQADLELAGPGPKAALGSAKVAGNLSGCAWDVGGVMGKLAVVGTARNVTVRSSGPMGGVSLGAAEHADFLAGIKAGVGRRATANDDFEDLTASIKSFKVAGLKLPKGQASPRLFVDSNVSAAWIGSVSLLNVDFDNDETLFGLWACDLTPGAEIKSVKWADTADKTAKGKWPPKGGGLFDQPDLAIEML